MERDDADSQEALGGNEAVRCQRGHLPGQGPGHERLPTRLRRLQSRGAELSGRRLAGGHAEGVCRGGGGVVCYHFAAAAFPKWKEYNRIIGVGGWGNRDETAGPYLAWREGKIVRATDPPGKAGFHGPQQTFQLVVRETDHPITRGLPKAFMHVADELYCRMRGPAEKVTVLATAFAPKDKGGTDEHEPLLMTITYGKGRIFNTLLGHVGEQLKSVSFIATFQRGAEWAATGKVTQAVPADFPTADQPRIRTADDAVRSPWINTGHAGSVRDGYLVQASPNRVAYKGSAGPGNGRHIVLISGDEEYRSEEALPQLAKILAKRHGFKCTVLFSIDPATGAINPNVRNNIPGLEALKSADLMVIFTRWRDLPDEQMRYIDEYVSAGKPIIGMRTATHAFNIPAGKQYAKYSDGGKDGGFGRQVLGEHWINHHGTHGKQSTRGLIVEREQSVGQPVTDGIHPICHGCDGIWGPTDVYEVRLPLPGDSRPVVMGQVLSGMKPTDKPVIGAKNEPMMPVAWVKTYKGAQGQTGRVFTTTMGASVDLQSEGLRRLLVNAAYWCLEMENKIPARANVAVVGTYKPTMYGFRQKWPSLKPADLAVQ